MEGDLMKNANSFTVFPAVDILDGKCVRLLKGDYNFISTYYDDPLEPALMWQEAGSKWLHIIDLDGAKTGEPVNIQLIKRIIKESNLKIQIGGGIRSLETAKAYIDAGVERVIIGSKALMEPEFAGILVEEFGKDKIVVSVDGKDNKALSEGWLFDSGKTLIDITRELVNQGVENFIFTDTEKDGTLLGPNLEMSLKLAGIAPKGIIVAGGIGQEKHVLDIAEKKGQGLIGAVIGRALYTGEIVLKDLLEKIPSSVPCKSGKRIIPCLDVKDGRVVKGKSFVNLKDAGDPVELAAFYEKEGADELVFLDISASLEGRKTMVDLVRKTAEAVSIPFIVGGGISTIEEVKTLLDAGADKVGINSAALNNPELIRQAAEKFGSQRIILAIDGKKSFGKEGKATWEVFTKGGTEAKGKDVLAWAQEGVKLGAGEILLTSIDQDGQKDGFDLELYQEVSNQLKIPVIASGGAGKKEDFLEVFTKTKVDAGLAASIFHFRELKISDLKEYLINQGVDMRC